MRRSLTIGSMLLGLAVVGTACSDATLGGMGGGGGGVSGGGPDSGVGPVVPGDPIVVQPDELGQWVWVPIQGMVCADGSPSGVGVRFTGASRNLVIWFQGN